MTTESSNINDVINNTSRTDDHQLLIHPNGYIVAAITLFFIGFFGFFLNLIVIIIMFKDKQLWTPLNIILFNLVCSDLSVAVLGNPFTLASAIATHWLFGSLMCTMYGFIMSLFGITSITTLTVLSFERYLMVSRPMQAQRYLNRRSAVFSVFAIWLYSIALTTPPLFGWGEYVNEAANISCSVNWESRTGGSTSYILFLFTMGLILPVSIISFSYINIISTMRKQQNNLQMGRVRKAENRVAMMVAIMIIAFIFAWTPYAIFALVMQFGDSTMISPGLAVIPALVAKSSICYNPIIYVGLNSQFHSTWRHFFSKNTNNGTSTDIGRNQVTKTNSKMFSGVSMNEPTDRRKQFASLKIVSCQDNRLNSDCSNNRHLPTTKTTQLRQFFPNKTITKSASIMSYKARRLSTVFFHEKECFIETSLVKKSSSLETIQ